jgi:hypothetical protein
MAFNKEKRKVKDEYKIEIGVLLFTLLTFGGYFTGVKATSLIQKDEVVEETTQTSNVSTSNLETKFISSSHIYMSDSKTNRIKIFEDFKEYLEEFFNTSIMKIRKPTSFKSTYEAVSSSGVKMSTNLDVIKFEYLNNETYYKIAETVKEDFEDLLTKIIYFSPSALKDCSKWNELTVTFEGSNLEIVRIKKRDFEELASKISIVRKCGKIQPEKNNEQTKKQYIVNLKTDSGEYKISTMGKSYIKIEFNDEFFEYFEVQSSFFDYLSNMFL